MFPATDWMPPAGVQRGSLNEYNGDPLTPLLPSRKDFYKEKTVEQVEILIKKNSKKYKIKNDIPKCFKKYFIWIIE